MRTFGNNNPQVVVVTETWRSWEGVSYLLFGVALAVPCLVLPLAADVWYSRDVPDAPWTWWSVRCNVWIAIVVFVASHFGTHYFYALLGVRYTLPTDGYEVNSVPVSMHLMAHPYFMTYVQL